jgi:hypothetical protein
VPCSAQYKDATKLALEQMDTIKRFVNMYPDTFKFVTTAQGMLMSASAGRKRNFSTMNCVSGTSAHQ